jgi:nucleotide-binding universal stress UspA family protein
LSWAADEAIATDAHLIICQARGEPVPGGPQPPTAVIELVDPPLARHIREVRDRLGGDRVEVALRGPDPVAALLDPHHHADLLVIGSATRHGITDRWFGTTMLRLTTTATYPVVVVRPIAGHGGAPFAGHVVVGVDASRTARAALRFGFEYAARHRLPIAPVHVTSDWPGDLWYDERMLETHFAVEPPVLAMLAGEVEPLASQYPDVVVKLAAYGGHPADGLLRASVGAGLLVVGRRCRGLSSVLDLRSVSEQVARKVGCTLAVVPATD